ncbi:leucine-rich repeat domain-containing protein [Saccharothrix variisporea]|uniref:Leucine rich repeat (LRR) protein n=1 Tax=Saccharothrix variisporea TaxID=543527 RepID=A0A495X138_9PSEU|nr:hypothetical protein [Saccharothrix variisporea]RKT67557.1 hypothetical protein DFJ66_0732 [Saccharothrix variisporea]
MGLKVRKDRDGTRTLEVEGDEPVDAIVRRFVDEGCTSVLVGFRQDADFLPELPGLTEVSFLRGVKDLSAVYRVPGLTRLALPTDHRGPLDLAAVPGLEFLVTPHCPGIEGLRELRSLRELVVHGWPSGDFAVLGDKPELRFLRLEMKRRAEVSALGLAGAPGVTTLWLYDGRLTDTRELAALTAVRELALRATKVDNVEFVAAMPELTRLELDNAGDIASLAPLRGHPSLRDLALAGSTRLVDGDFGPLFDMPALKGVGLDHNAPHYTHRAADIRQAFPPI